MSSSRTYKDLHEFVDTLEMNNEVKHVVGAGSDLEIGVLTELMYEHEGPALLFEDIPNYSNQYKILANGTATFRRALLALGWDPDTEIRTAMDKFMDMITNIHGVPPKVISDGPVMENVVKGDDVDLRKFPAPKWHEFDGGHYIGTGDAVIMRDPDEKSFVNIGVYRMMVHDANTGMMWIQPRHQGDIIRRKYWAKGKSCPIAISLGHSPEIHLAGFWPIPWGMSEYDMAGHIKGASVEVIIDEISGLPIPANSEAVLIGETVPEMKDEGPFGEFWGYYAHGVQPEPVIKIKAIYHRSKPIFSGYAPQKPNGANTYGFGFPYQSGFLLAKLKRTGLPGIVDAWELSKVGVTVVKIKQLYYGHSWQVARATAGVEPDFGRFIVVVDDDVNIRDRDEVLWVMSTRCDPKTDIEVLDYGPTNALDPRIPPDKRAKREYTTGRLIINACRPYEWLNQFPRVVRSSDSARQEIHEKWKNLFE